MSKFVNWRLLLIIIIAVLILASPIYATTIREITTSKDITLPASDITETSPSLIDGRVSIAPHTESLIEKDNLLLYVAQNTSPTKQDTILKGVTENSDESEEITDNQFTHHKKRMFLSPNRKLIAVTVENYYTHEPLLTYIADMEGNIITSAQPGYFVSWTPDSNKIMLFLSGFEPNIRGRQIYYLTTGGEYYHSELPTGTADADTSVNGEIVYVLTKQGTDESTLYVRNPKGEDKLLLEGNNNTFSWSHYSPVGDKIAFIKSNLALKEAEVWIINSDGSSAEKISNVNMFYPPVWSKDGSKLLFTNGTDVWEYHLDQKTLTSLTNFTEGIARHPNYSADESMVVFSRELNKETQIWSVDREGEIKQLTNDNKLKTYPLMP